MPRVEDIKPTEGVQAATDKPPQAQSPQSPQQAQAPQPQRPNTLENAGVALPGNPEVATVEDWARAHREALVPSESHPTALPGVPPGVATPPAQGREGATHYVVTTGALGARWQKGDVVPVEAFGEGVDFDRLLSLGAVRPADERESVQKRLTLPDAAPPPALEHALMDRQRHVEKLEMEVANLREQLRQAKQQAPVPPAAAPPPLNQGLIAEKDKVIESLRRRVQELEAQRQDAAAQAQSPDEPRGRKK